MENHLLKSVSGISILIYYTSHDCLTSNGVSEAVQNFTKIQCIYEEKFLKVFSYYDATFPVILNIFPMAFLIGNIVHAFC